MDYIYTDKKEAGDDFMIERTEKLVGKVTLQSFNKEDW